MISRYLLNKYPQNLLGSELKRLDEKKLFSLIKLNNSRIKMREALGFTLYDNLEKVIDYQWGVS